MIFVPIPLWRSSDLSLKLHFSIAPRASRHDLTTPVPRRVIHHSIGRDDSRGDYDRQAMVRTMYSPEEFIEKEVGRRF